MKIAYASDLHLEYAPINLVNTENADVLVLAGDVCVNVGVLNYDPSDIIPCRFQNFFKECSEQFKNVIYIAGNHEHYYGDYKTTITELKQKLSHLPNIHVLDNEVALIDGVAFAGTTLWTDLNRNDPITKFNIMSIMNDYKVIDNFTPEDSYNAHIEALKFIDYVCQEHKEVIVVGHHTPSDLSVPEEYKRETITNGGYRSDLSEFILDRQNVKLWFCGHTHHVHQYNIGDTVIACNPRGYAGAEKSAFDFQLQYIEI